MKFGSSWDVDGFRLDAVPYLWNGKTRTVKICLRPTPSSRNSEKTRRTIPRQNASRGKPINGPRICGRFRRCDEFHMVVHFPLMPRMFMGVKLEDRKPITEILQKPGNSAVVSVVLVPPQP